MKNVAVACVAAFAMAGLATAVSAQPRTESAYTDLNLDDCIVMNADDFGASWACPGYKGYPLYVAEGDLRFFVSFGFGAPEETAAVQTPPYFNTIGPKLEWRLSNASGDWRPFASILRYYVTLGSGEKESQVLVVTRIEPGATCHIAYIDATENSNANELAQAAADEDAADFDCANDEPSFSDKFDAWER